MMLRVIHIGKKSELSVLMATRTISCRVDKSFSRPIRSFPLRRSPITRVRSALRGVFMVPAKCLSAHISIAVESRTSFSRVTTGKPDRVRCRTFL